MEAPMSASQGPVRSLPSKLKSLTKHGLRAEEKKEIRKLGEDLQVLIGNYLLEPSEVESPVSTAHSWMKDVRDLSYDIDDFIYELAQVGTCGARINVLQLQIPPRFKVSRSRFRPKLKRREWITDEISGFRIRVTEAIRRHKEYLGDWKRRPSSIWLGQRRSGPSSPCSPSGTGIRLVGVDSSIEQLCIWLANDLHADHKVASIVGTGGVGKTTLAKQVYRRFRGKFDCLAFVQTSRRTDMKMLLTSILSQVRPNHLTDSCEVDKLIPKIYEHLQDKTYLMVIDDLWSLSTWDTVNRALPKGELCSRILMTTEVNVIAQKCCADNSKYFSPKKEDNSTYMLSEKEDKSKYMTLKKKENHMHITLKKEDNYMCIINKGPLCEVESRELFLSTVFGHQAECPQGLKEVSNEIIKRSGGLPLTINILASLLARLPDNSIQQWNYIKNSLSSGLTRNNSLEGINQVLNLCYDNLPHNMKACMLYMCMYEEDRVILKDDLVNLWMAEGFICAMAEDDEKEVACSYFDELVNRGMIQPVDTNCNDEILSCSMHHMVLHFIRYKSIEENFSIAIEHSQTTMKLADKVRRLALHFGNVEDATPPAPVCMRLSKVRSLSFSGLLKCMPSIVDFRILQVLILKLWDDPDNRSDNLTKPADLTEISELFRLRYFLLDACHLSVKLPTQIQGLKDLVAWEIYAKVTSVPSDIGCMTSLRTLGIIDLGKNSTESFMSLGELTNLQDLRLTCSTLKTDNLEKNLECLGSIIRKLTNLKCVTLAPAVSSPVHDAGASSMSTTWHGFANASLPPALLQTLKLSWRCCIFSSLPPWITELTKLRILKIALRKMSTEDVVILSGLPSLTALSLFIWTAPAPARRIIFDKEGFSVLKYFKFVCAAPCLEFLEGAMPNVRKLKIGFNANIMDTYSFDAAGFKHLTGLNEISIKIGSTGADEGDRKSAESLLTDAIGMHPSTPIINVQWVDWDFCGDDEKHTEPPEEIQDEISEKKNVTAVESSGEHEIQEKNLEEYVKKHPGTRYPRDIDDFMQWAPNSLDQHQHPAAAPPPAYVDGGGAGPAAFPFPLLQALLCPSIPAVGGARDLTVQVDQHLAASSWSASSSHSPGAAVMDHDATTAAAVAGWSVRGGRPSTPAAGRRAGWPVLAAPTAASHGQGAGGGGTTAASSSASARIITERRRRDKINQGFIELSTVIPGLKNELKMDKAAILGDAAKYVRELQEKVKTLEDRGGAAAANTTTTIPSAALVNKKIKPCIGLASDDEANTGDASTDGAGGLPEIEVRVPDEKSVLVRIHCENARGVLVRVLAEVEALWLSITHTGVMPFPANTTITTITITAKVEEGFNSTVEEIVRRLNSALNQHCSANCDQNTAKREC